MHVSRPLATTAIALTIAGSEASGGAGAQTDLKTFHTLGVYGCTALTCIVSMDPKAGFDHPPRTWDEWNTMMAAIKKMQGPDRYAVLMPINEFEQQLSFGLQTDDPLLKDHDTRGNFSAPGFRKALGFYRRFVRGACVTTTSRAAEMTKLTENAFRDVNIAFANELSLVADTMGVDVWEVIRLANRHPRVNILQPGPGVGGHCIAVDPWFLVAADPANTPLIRTARDVNDGKTDHVIAQASAMIEALPPHATVACLGLAFKANIDDFRESPALKVAAALARRFGERVRIVEPYADRLPTAFDGTGAALIDLDTALEGCAAMVVLVDHDLFRSVPAQERADKRVIDTRGIWPDQPRVVTIDGAPLRLAV